MPCHRRPAPAGSSPRGRGKRRMGHESIQTTGIIPARAGKTVSAGKTQCPRPDHPRAGGENGAGRVSPSTREGSSPRGRGKRRILLPLCARWRIIPARAGKTTTTTTLCRAQTDHPRAGGENLTSVAMSLWVFGSSPRGRGKPTRELESFTVPGIIPARAGKTYGDSATRNRLRDHPRAGGENGYTPGRDIYHFGSSPRGRGKRGPRSRH